jgi:UDPglucose--hexose-1-phosphate uridylyltransferase
VPRHARSLAELTGAELALIARAWRERVTAARKEGFAYIHALLNEGRLAGGSLPHSHTQLLWLREPPDLVTRERTATNDCGVCELLAETEYRLAEQNGVVSSVHRAGRLPYELLVAPAEHGTDWFAGDTLTSALELLADGIRRLHAVAGPVPLNAWLHSNGHWHIELVPRLSILAGIELGAGLYINAVAPEDAVASLHGVA